MKVAQHRSKWKVCANCQDSWRRGTRPATPKGFCSQACHDAYYGNSVMQAERFWTHVERCVHGETCTACCWVWTGAQTRGEYGNLAILVDGRRHMLRAHRMSWILAHGDIQTGLNVLHNCPGGENRLCVNPAHLWLGTHKENTADARQKGRLATGERHGLHRYPERAARGERQGNALLNAEQVLDIRYLAAHGMPHLLLGRIYAVSHGTIGAITRGKNWKHLPLIVEER